MSALRTRRLTPLLLALAVALSLLIPGLGGATSFFTAKLVLGQPGFFNYEPSTTGMRDPAGVFVDPAGHVLVADSRNHRVLGWNSLPPANGAPPDFVLGQISTVFDQPNRGLSPAADTMRCPQSVWSDGQRVLVADRGNNRILVFDNLWGQGPPSNGAPATMVLGQPSLNEGPAASSDPCSPAPKAVQDATTLNRPHGVFSDGTRVFVADTGNNRVLIWNTFPQSNGQPASLAVGQLDLTSVGVRAASSSSLKAPEGVTSDGSRLYVADTGNHRVLIFDPVPVSTGQSASLVLGQPNMTNNGPNASPPNDPFATDAGRGKPSDRSLRSPVMAQYVSGLLAISDRMNHRVLLFRGLPSSDFESAQYEIGHGRFTYGGPGNAEFGLSVPWGISLSAAGILVGDSGNNRVLLFQTPPTTSSGSLTAVANSDLSITLSWTAQANASGYRIYRDGFWLNDVQGGASTSYTDPELSPDVYKYRLVPLYDQNRIEGQDVGSVEISAIGSLPPQVVRRHARYERYLAEGDSIAAGGVAFGLTPPSELYPKQIGQYAASSSTNRAVSGANCIDTVARLRTTIPQVNPDLVTVGIGLNDVFFGYRYTRGAESMVQYRDCMRSLVSVVSPGQSRTLLLVNFSHMTNWTMTNPPFSSDSPDVTNAAGSEAKKRAWNKVMRDVAAHAGVPIVDVTSAMDDALARHPEKDFLVDDNVHPDQDGQDVISQVVASRVLDFQQIGLSPIGMPVRPKPHSERVDLPVGGKAKVTVTVSAPSGNLRESDPLEVQWSQNGAFVSGVTGLLTGASTLTADLGRGRWYVRVRGIGPDGQPGPWSLNGRVDVVAPNEPTASPTSLDFGTLDIGEAETLSLTLKNTSKEEVRFGSSSIQGSEASDFSIASDGCASGTLAPSASCVISVSFTPGNVGTRQADLLLEASAGTGVLSYRLLGIGYLPGGSIKLSPSPVTFGSWGLGMTSVPKPLTVSNIGDGPMAVGAATITGTDAAAFSIASDGCAGVTLQPAASCVIQIVFSAAQVRNFVADIEVPSDAASGRPNTTLTGTGVQDIKEPTSRIYNVDNSAAVSLIGKFVLGRAEDDASGIDRVEITYVSADGKSEVVNASLFSCELNRTKCEFQAPPPRMPGLYTVISRAVDKVHRVQTNGYTVRMLMS